MSHQIVWIRHGRSSWNAEERWQGHSDIELDQEGRAQAGRLGLRLKGQIFDRVFSSDLVRAQDTARLALPQAELTLDARLREVNFGDFEGCRYHDLDSERSAELSRWWKNPYDAPIPGGESMRDLALRISDWFDDLPPGRYAVFTHGGVIRHVLWQVTGAPQGGAWTVELGNTSITEIHYGRRVTILRVNDQAHLE